MLTVKNENHINFDEKKSVVCTEIFVDTADELPAVNGIPDRILYQGSTALIIKEGKIAILSGDGHWYVNKEMIK